MAKKNSDEKFPEANDEPPVMSASQDWIDDIQISLSHLTVFRIPGGLVISNPSLPHASRFFPVIGGLIGLSGAIILFLCDVIGLPYGATVALALFFLASATGGKNEFGLAKILTVITSDARNSSKRVSRLRTVQLGAIGITTLSLMTLLKWATISSMSVNAAAATLITAAVLSNGTIPILMRYLPTIHEKGDTDTFNHLQFDKVATAILLSLIISFIISGFWLTFSILIALFIITGITAWWLTKLFGGHNKEILGTLQQVCEIVIMVTIAGLGS